MLGIDRPFEGLDEVWVWRIPHPADPEEPRKGRSVTRIGTREGTALVGRVQITTRPSRTMIGPTTDLDGLGEWKRTKLGQAGVQRSDEFVVYGGGVEYGGVEATWKSGGTFRVGEHEERNQIATGGYPYPPSVRELGESALDFGKSLLRRARNRGDDALPPAEVQPAERPGPVEATAFDGWLVATPVHEGDHLTWRITIDRRPDAPESVGLGIVSAALALLHQG